ncbi:hypothetical protein EDEG_00361 [Edhazardia aedis USNM 41457]|uniref:Sm domain-containing protein n=1 Tax=Edhazardia aedis (strain USNM 41457) TaxID=1003232 RepID=J9DGN3_EDHAE|nr:hypothetical protein EDEG_00361 [Edhazardia aedis USNM 41457]|eukprot:EJW01770.1 hypothetical protein EDEG_00361 [Edhazardia aedis USNM 41457]
MYPLTLIRISKGKKVVVELKNNDVYEGLLKGCDLSMNLFLKNVSVTKTFLQCKEGFEPEYLQECYLKGSVIKHIRLHNEVLNVQSNLETKGKDFTNGKNSSRRNSANMRNIQAEKIKNEKK